MATTFENVTSRAQKPFTNEPLADFTRPENKQAQAVSPAHSQLPPSMVSSGQPWPAQEPIAPGSAAGSSSGQDGRLAASSVIDMNALPDWLRSSGGQQPGGLWPGQRAGRRFALRVLHPGAAAREAAALGAPGQVDEQGRAGSDPRR